MTNSNSDADGASVERLLTVDAVADLLGISRVWVMHMAQENRFPRPIRVGARRLAFRATEVQAWIDARERAWKAPEVAA
jgi:prophage regulatory protein